MLRVTGSDANREQDHGFGWWPSFGKCSGSLLDGKLILLSAFPFVSSDCVTENATTLRHAGLEEYIQFNQTYGILYLEIAFLYKEDLPEALTT